MIQIDYQFKLKVEVILHFSNIGEFCKLNFGKIIPEILYCTVCYTIVYKKTWPNHI